MATPPDFSVGQVLTAAQMNAVGLWLVKTQTVGSAVSSVTVTDAFSADYENYLVVVNSIDFTALDQICQIRFGATATGYYGSMRYDQYTGTTAIVRLNNASGLYWSIGGQNDDTSSTFTVYAPFLTKRTLMSGTYHGAGYSGWFGGQVSNTTSYTAFTVFPASGTMTGGTISVYGYNI